MGSGNNNPTGEKSNTYSNYCNKKNIYKKTPYLISGSSADAIIKHPTPPLKHPKPMANIAKIAYQFLLANLFYAPSTKKLAILPDANPATKHSPMNPPLASLSPSSTHAGAAIIALLPTHPLVIPNVKPTAQ